MSSGKTAVGSSRWTTKLLHVTLRLLCPSAHCTVYVFSSRSTCLPTLSSSLSPTFPLQGRTKEILKNLHPPQTIPASMPRIMQNPKTRTSTSTILLLLLFIIISPTLASSTPISPSPSPSVNYHLPNDGSALLSFKSSADPTNKLNFTLNKPFDYCQWVGVKCGQGKVVRLHLQHLQLNGTFAENTLTKLDQLRVLSLKYNNLTGSIPNLSSLINLKTLFLDHNSFTGNFPPSILSLHRIRIVDLSSNNFTGKIPDEIETTLDRIYYLRLDGNGFTGTVPALNQSSLKIFNVSANNLTGPVPITVALSSFNFSSFLGNPGLCGRVIGKSCVTQSSPFFNFNSSPPPQQQLQGETSKKKNSYKRAALMAGVFVLVILLILFMGFWVMLIRKKSMPENASVSVPTTTITGETSLSVSEAKLKKMQNFPMGKSGNLIFCAGETQIYSLDTLMRASAEMLGRGTIGTTYKAVLENQLIVSVKRLDAQNSNMISREMFETHMEMVGNLRHPNLVPLRGYFQAKEERLLIYDYQPNGSLFSLIHGIRSSRAKPLHWTSCLKIAEDVAQGLVYIHQASRVVHGNLKLSNVLLGADFEACVTDYGLTIFEEGLVADDNNGLGYRAPEARKSNRRLNAKSDVYSFGVLLLEIITGKTPLQSFFINMDLPNWVRSVREEEGDSDEGSDKEKLVMILEIAMACLAASSDQRPTMREVLKMIQEIKDVEMIGEAFDSSCYPDPLPG